MVPLLLEVSNNIFNYNFININLKNIENKSIIIKNYDGETKEFSELLDKLEKKHMCHRYYCYFCLKGSYDTLAENIKDNNAWLCPFCTGACYCTRCMRNEKILQLIAYYFSINGDINYLYDELINRNSIIDELFTNFVLNNIYLIIYDKNSTPAQMINNFMNFDTNKLNEIQIKEDEINNLKEQINILKQKKEEIHNEFVSYCKDKYEIKQKYNLNNEKNIINNDVNDIIYHNLNYELEDKNNNIKEEEKEENYLKYKDEENYANEGINIDKKDGIKTRKKKKIIYYKDKYYNRRVTKRIVRKYKEKIINKSNKYYIDQN